MIKSCSIFNFFHPAVWIIQDEKESDPMLIFLSGNRPLADSDGSVVYKQPSRILAAEKNDFATKFSFSKR